jgi:hypothetical protein
MFEVIDANGDGEVSWCEFLWFMLFLKKLHVVGYDHDSDDEDEEYGDGPDGGGAIAGTSFERRCASAYFVVGVLSRDPLT